MADELAAETTAIRSLLLEGLGDDLKEPDVPLVVGFLELSTGLGDHQPAIEVDHQDTAG